MEHSTAVKLKKLTAKNKMGNGELHHLRNWFWNSHDIEIFSEPIIFEFHSLEKFQSIAYEASNYSMRPFDIDGNDNKSSLLVCLLCCSLARNCLLSSLLFS